MQPQNTKVAGIKKKKKKKDESFSTLELAVV